MDFIFTKLDHWLIPSPAPDALDEMFRALDLEWIQDIPYKKAGERILTLDVLRPRDLPADRLHPAVFCIHGGAWRKGTNKNYNAATFAANGYVTFNLRYRFTGEALYPAGLDDCKDALKWIAENGPAYGADPERLAIRGGSSGAHYSLMLALEHAMHPDPSYHLCAVLAACAPSNMPECCRAAQSAGLGFATAFDALVGHEIGDNYACLEPLSPLHILNRMEEEQLKRIPPILLIHGTSDPLVPYRQSLEFFDALKHKGILSELHLLENAEHNYMFDAGRFCPERMAVLLRFLERHLGPSWKESL